MTDTNLDSLDITVGEIIARLTSGEVNNEDLMYIHSILSPVQHMEDTDDPKGIRVPNNLNELDDPEELSVIKVDYPYSHLLKLSIEKVFFQLLAFILGILLCQYQDNRTLVLVIMAISFIQSYVLGTTREQESRHIHGILCACVSVIIGIGLLVSYLLTKTEQLLAILYHLEYIVPMLLIALGIHALMWMYSRLSCIEIMTNLNLRMKSYY